MVPFDAEPTLRVLESNVFYTSPNVSAAKSNNKLKFSVITSGTVADFSASTTDHTITFPDGLYSLADINAELADYLESKSSIADLLFRSLVTGPLRRLLRIGTRKRQRTAISSGLAKRIRSHRCLGSPRRI